MDARTVVSDWGYKAHLTDCATLLLDLLRGAIVERRKIALADKPRRRDAPTVIERISECLEVNGPLSPRELCVRVQCSPMSASRALKTLLAGGKIRAHGRTRSLRYESAGPLGSCSEPSPVHSVTDRVKTIRPENRRAAQGAGPCPKNPKRARAIVQLQEAILTSKQ